MCMCTHPHTRICVLAPFFLRKETDARRFPLQVIQLFPGLSGGLGEVLLPGSGGLGLSVWPFEQTPFFI